MSFFSHSQCSPSMNHNATFTPMHISVVYLQPDKQITTTASLSLLPACSFLHLTCSPQICCRQCSVLDVQVSIDFQDWEKTQQLYRSPSSPLLLPSRLHTSLQHYPLFIPFYVWLIDLLLPSSYLWVFLFLALEPVIHAYSDRSRLWGYIVFNHRSVVETFMYMQTTNRNLR